MKKIISIVLVLLISSMVSADRAVVGYYQMPPPYNDYVIVYTYTQADGTIGLSHCRTNKNAYFQYAFSQQTTLNLSDCDFSYTPTTVTNSPDQGSIVNPQVGNTFSTERAF